MNAGARSTTALRAMAIAAVVAASLAGCSETVRRRDWSAYDGPGAAGFRRDEIELPHFADPLEPVNRVTTGINDALVRTVVAPLARGYRSVAPSPLRRSLANFAENLAYPRRALACLLQGEGADAWMETRRFALNTTLGVGGFFDPATARGLVSSGEDFGQTFAVWGWRNSTFVALPLYGPSSVRDTVGLLPDTATNLSTYVQGLGPALALNSAADFVDPYLRFTAANSDPYNLVRLAWTLYRRDRIEEGRRRRLPRRGDDSGEVQTLQSLFFSPEDAAFVSRLKTGRAPIAATGRRLPYSYLVAGPRAPVVFLLPGLGAHRGSDNAVALAELVHRRGFSVVVVSSAMNAEFMENAATTTVPGNAAYDAADVAAALEAVSADLSVREGALPSARVLMGYSLGAFHALHIAARQQSRAGAAPGEAGFFDRFVSLDAPVRLDYGLARLDDFFNAPTAYPVAEREARVRAILDKVFAIGERYVEASRVESLGAAPGQLWPSGELPLTDLEAKFLIGLAFRLLLQQTIFASQSREDLGVLLTPRNRLRRGPAYREIADYSFTEYLYAFVLPYYRDRRGLVSSADELVAANDLRTLAAPLARSGRIHLFANVNDFLTDAADIRFLVETLGADRVRYFPTGGHLGGLGRPEVQAEILGSIEDLVAAPVQ